LLRAEFTSKGGTLPPLYGKAHNSKNNLVTSACSNLMIYEP